MGIGYFTYIGHTGTASGPAVGGGAPPLPVEKSMGDHLKYKNQCHFQYDTTKSLSISEVRRAKLGQIQGGLQRAIKDSTKGGLQYFFTFYALKIELFRVFTLSD